jgi:NAD(P)-dependent dehydrogenase (short-subunit alcohol dehydrogenase family)
MLTQQAALDYGPSKVRCNVICPGAIRTEMLDQLIGPLSKKLGTDMAGGFAFFSSNVPIRRVGKPEEIAALCSFLASDESGFMTGSVLVMDGGAHIVDVSGATITSMADK